MNVMMALFLIVILIPVYVSVMFIPFWTRKTESFGVSIPEKFYARGDIQSFRRRYAFYTGLLSAGLTALLFFLAGYFTIDEQRAAIGFSILIFVYLAGTFVVYLFFHRKMKKLKKEEQWEKVRPQGVVVDTQFREQRLTYSNLWFAVPFLIAFLTIGFTFQLYDQIPDRFPMQYSFSGEVTNWAEKSYRTVLVMPVMQLYMAVLFLFINVMIAKAKQQVSAEDPENSRKQNVVFRRRWSAFIILTSVALTLLFSFVQYTFIYTVSPVVINVVTLIFTLAVVAASIVLSITTGQGGSRVKTGQGTTTAGRMDRDDDRYWKLGQFYYNRNDPALFLEKRFGIGWTINFGRPTAWIILIVIVVLAAGIPLVLGR
ncbi:DUF5808 domain-containing protein [Halobacillus salinarum]|uniref:DUF5808 domain-containing protein n=1 Tax=Halobacillus salinarum TaxID=2932257 RepID=A0ABY4ESN9_9BACI|nr:DUF5808 domain-containing protein [Halobacillus salinarum]UOQ45161.1 DUF5808 domain-containing protein [Halobacillus salinarum]